MSILFEPLASTLVTGPLTGGYNYGCRALGLGLEAGIARCNYGYGVNGLLFQEDEDFVPEIPPMIYAGYNYGVSATGYAFEAGSAQVTYYYGVRSHAGSMLRAGYNYGVAAYELPPLGAYGFFIEPMPYMAGYGGVMFATFLEEVSVSDEDPVAALIYTLTELFALTDTPAPLVNYLQLITDSVVVRDFVTVVFDRTFLDTVDLADALTPEWVVTVADVLMIQDERLSLLDALVTVVSSLVVRDNVVPILLGTVESPVALTDEQTAHIIALVEAASALVMSDELTNTMMLFGEVRDDLVLDFSSPAALLSVLTELMDTVVFGVRVRVGDDLFAGYVVNTRNAAVSRYENFPFNSFALVGGKPYGAGPDGVYRLTGDDDAGEPIQALLRTGIANFEELVHVPNAWIGLTSTGQMILKTITMDKGRKKENWYRMKERPQGTPVESRFDPAKGLAGTYWQWELENVDGAYFELDMLKVWPVRIGRRYSGR